METQRVTIKTATLMSCALMLMPIGAKAEEFSHDGVVVKYGSETPLEGIEVQIRKNKRNLVDPIVTQSDGNYTFELDEKEGSFTLRFIDTRAQVEYNANAQFGVQNDAHPNSLGTQGLVSIKQAGNNEEAAKHAHDGNRRFESSANMDDEDEGRQMESYFAGYYSGARKYGEAFHNVARHIHESNFSRDGFGVPKWFLENRHADSIK